MPSLGQGDLLSVESGLGARGHADELCPSLLGKSWVLYLPHQAPPQGP